jgi:hypothetical protein
MTKAKALIHSRISSSDEANANSVFLSLFIITMIIAVVLIGAIG